MSIRDLETPTPKVLNDCYFNNVYIGGGSTPGTFQVTDTVRVNSTNGVNYGYMQDTPDGKLKLQSAGASNSTIINPDGGQIVLGQANAFDPLYNVNIHGVSAIDSALYVGTGTTNGQLWLASGNNHGLYRTSATNDINLKTTAGAVYVDTVGNGNANFRINQNLQNGARPLYLNNPTAGIGCYADFNDPSNRFIVGVNGSAGSGVANSAFLGTYTNSDILMYRNGIQSMKINSNNDMELAKSVIVANSSSTSGGTVKYNGSNVVIANSGGVYDLINPLNIQNTVGLQLKVCVQNIYLTVVAGSFVVAAASTDFGFSAPAIISQAPLIVDVTCSSITNTYYKNASMVYTSATATESFTPYFTSDSTPTNQMKCTRSTTGLPISNTDFVNTDTLLFQLIIIGS